MSEDLNRGIRDFSKYDSMATEELEEILRLDAEAPEGEESDTELLLYVMEVLAGRRKQANITGKTAQEAWESFLQNYMPEECLEPEKERRAKTWLRRLAAAAAVIALVVILPVSARALSLDKLWDIFARWAKETFSFVSGESAGVGEPSPVDEEVYTSLQQALEDNNRDADFIPTMIPEGFVLEKIEKDITPVQEIYRAYYKNGEKVLRIRVQTYLSTDVQSLEIEEDVAEIYAVSGMEYYIFDNLDQIQAIWIQDMYECIISGDISIDELKCMIDSIGKG